MYVSKIIQLKAEEEFGVDVVLEVMEAVEEKGIRGAEKMFAQSEQFEHCLCIDYMYAETD